MMVQTMLFHTILVSWTRGLRIGRISIIDLNFGRHEINFGDLSLGQQPTSHSISIVTDQQYHLLQVSHLTSSKYLTLDVIISSRWARISDGFRNPCLAILITLLLCNLCGANDRQESRTFLHLPPTTRHYGCLCEWTKHSSIISIGPCMLLLIC
jgi:hypothetical protein